MPDNPGKWFYILRNVVHLHRPKKNRRPPGADPVSETSVTDPNYGKSDPAPKIWIGSGYEKIMGVDFRFVGQV